MRSGLLEISYKAFLQASSTVVYLSAFAFDLAIFISFSFSIELLLNGYFSNARR